MSRLAWAGAFVAACASASAKPAAVVRVPAGFRAELIYAPPLEVEGSWVSLTVDDRGRLIASDQQGGLYRITPPPLDGGGKADVEAIGLGIGMAQGLEFIDGKLYVMLNGIHGALSSGLYRLSDTTGDDRFDKVEQLRVWNGVGEHGPHAVVMGPNRRSLYVCCGNNTRPPLFDRTRVPNVWRDDRLLPPLFAQELIPGQFEPPGAWIARMDLNGEILEFYAAGYRNIYDIAFDADGELFTFDSDNEGDVGLPWYRPTRVCHVVSGVDMGWRPTDGIWSPRFIDSLPASIDVGPGSPTGLAFGTTSKFPPKYQRAMFAGEWSYGKIYAIHLRPDGAGYRGEVEQFAAGMPLPVTDLVVNPRDGALYFITGGRRIETGLYRIAWTGQRDAAPADAPLDPELAARGQDARAQRKALEALHVGSPDGAAKKVWSYLSSRDPELRSAARIALEHQPIERWGEQALNESNPRARLAALAAMARTGAPVLGDVWTEALRRVDCAKLPPDEQLDYLRTASLGLLRLELSAENQGKLLTRLDPLYLIGDAELDGVLAQLLVRLEAPEILPRLLESLAAGATTGEGYDAARSLSVIRSGWDLSQRRAMLAWFRRAALESTAGNFKTLVEIRNRFLATLSDEERAKLSGELSNPFEQPAAPASLAARRFVREWKLAEAVAVVEQIGDEADAKRGKKLFVAAQCARCHAFAGTGSAVGPDLTGVGGRFSVPDLLRSVIQPNDMISDQYQQTLFTVNGRVFNGRISNMDGDEYYVSTDLLDPTKYVKFHKDDLEDQRPSTTSMMPAGLLDSLDANELADLVAFLRSGGK